MAIIYLRSLQIVTTFVVFAAISFIGCNKVDSSNASTSNDSPTEAYKRLFNAVKSKDTEDIKKQLSQKTQGLAASSAARQNKPIDEVYENGFTATTFSPNLPEIRDERVSGNMGALEVYNSKDRRWEDLPFVFEDGQWKLAFGDIFANTYKSPGKGRAQKEAEAANAAGNNMTVIHPNVNVPGMTTNSAPSGAPGSANSR
jgi:hypothetical protein